MSLIDAKYVLFHYAVAQVDNHLHLFAASWLAPLAQRHDMMRNFQHIAHPKSTTAASLCFRAILASA
tara:strand:+ start:63 stop:263 length:201 start_codon:yes stop_codon:yes gene_type:complete